MTAPAPEVVLAVVSWNTRDLLGRCLESIAPAAEAGRVAVWVVDNGSADGSADLVSERFGWAELVRSPVNLGFGAAINLVAERTRSPWIAAANADVELGGVAIETLLAAGEANPDAGSLAPRLATPSGRTQHSVHSFPSLRLALAFNLGLARALPGLGDRMLLDGYWDPARNRTVDWAHGAFLLLRRRAFEAVGGFDPEQWLYAEDLDLAWRLARAGWRTRYVAAATVRHVGGAATRQAFGEQSSARHVAASYDWLVRRRGVASARAYAALNTLGSALRLRVASSLAERWPHRFEVRRQLEARHLPLHRAGLRSSRSASSSER